jgi:hypothetical protein
MAFSRMKLHFEMALKWSQELGGLPEMLAPKELGRNLDGLGEAS